MLLGMTAVGGLFTEDVIRAMASGCDRPVIFPLSNPTTNAECTAEQAFEWTEGRCIFASGSPFQPVTLASTGETFHPTQCNNMYVFPGVGLGATVCGAKSVTDRMLYLAAEELANFVTPEELAAGKVFPKLSEIRSVSHKIAVAVVKEAIRDGQASLMTKYDKMDIEQFVSSKMYYPEYVPLVEKREIAI